MPGTRDGATRKQDMATEKDVRNVIANVIARSLHADVYGMCPC